MPALPFLPPPRVWESEWVGVRLPGKPGRKLVSAEAKPSAGTYSPLWPTLLFDDGKSIAGE